MKKSNVDPKKVEAVKKFITSSKLVKETAKQILFALIDRYNESGQPVSLSVFESDAISHESIVQATGEVEDICGRSGAINLNGIAQQLFGVNFVFQAGHGWYNKNNVYSPNEKDGQGTATFWFTPHGKHHASKHFTFNETISEPAILILN
jgi:hypothetical protein